ncbi:MAG TPA: hypothetical protein VHQ47_08625, partial [Phycisphaerae bacterium]|nr:hypothetical protein [Phycisphaerae bacterium]
MLPRPPILVGCFLGLAAAAAIIAFHQPAPRHPPRALLPEAAGPIKTVLLQYAPGATFVHPVYKAFLSQQSPTLTVYLACPDPTAFNELTAALGPVPPRLTPIFTHHLMTPW